MLLVDTVSVAEVACAVAAATAGTLASALVFSSGAPALRPSARLVRAAATQLARVPADLGLLGLALGRALTRRRPGRFHGAALELAVDPDANARRAAIELLGSLAPNTIVLGVDEEHVLVHQLLGRRSERQRIREIGA